MEQAQDQQDALVPSWQGNYPEEVFDNAFVIGLAGFIGVGKTAIADVVIDKINQQAGGLIGRRMSFADRLKETLAAFTGQAGCYYREAGQKQARIYGVSPMTVREWMIEYATTFVRDGMGEDYWLDVVAQQLTKLEQPTVVVIDDYRFPNESRLIGATGVGVLIKRPGVEQAIKHRSEQAEALGISNVINNDSTIEAAAQAVIKLVEDNQRYQQLKAKAG